MNEVYAKYIKPVYEDRKNAGVCTQCGGKSKDTLPVIVFFASTVIMHYMFLVTVHIRFQNLFLKSNFRGN